MRANFNVTYEIYTLESVEQCDTAECGFIDSRGRQNELLPDMCGEPAGKLKAQCAMTLRDALSYVSTCFDSGSGGLSYYEADGRRDYRSGSEERRALHLPDNATGATVQRIARLLRS